MNKKMNNKGFSLVELIIVIAIMAVLIGVLAPQYIRYVERSRVSADQTTVDQFVSAMQIIASDPDMKLDTSKEYSVKADAGTDTLTISGELETILYEQGVFDEEADELADMTLESGLFTDEKLELILEYDDDKHAWYLKKTIPANEEPTT